MTAPLPCPFCGGTEVNVVEGSTFRWLVAECALCGAKCGEVRKQTLGAGTPDDWEREGRRDAIKEWNKRAGLAERRLGIIRHPFFRLLRP
jgi:Lar family restriction alleviation protein